MEARQFFDDAFQALTGHPPFGWQRRLFLDHFASGHIPEAVDIPTGLGKTSVIAIWLIALALQSARGAPTLPRRLVYVVDRRTVVDQATETASRMRKALAEAAAGSAAASVRDALALLCADPGQPLAISTLRGELADNREWQADPARAAIIVGTVDMIGSRLLFSGYGISRKMRAFHAGLIGQDALILHDEAHLSPAFGTLIGKVASVQSQCREPRPLQAMDLSATQRDGAGERVFGLREEEKAEAPVAARLAAQKRLRFLPLAGGKPPEQQLADAALGHREKQARILVYVRSPKSAVEVSRCIGAEVGRDAVAVLTGTIRGYERDRLTADPKDLEDEEARKRAELFRSFRAAPERDPPERALYLVATSAGEVGIDLDADHMVCDLATLDSMIQRLGRVNRLGRKDEDFVAEIDVVDAPPEKAKGEEAAEASDRQKRVEATREVLQPADASEGREVSPQALRDLVEGMREEERRDAFSKMPDILDLTDVLLDGWAMTSVKTLPGRPLVESWLHGVTSDPPSTYVAWREEVDQFTNAEIPADALKRLFDKHRILPRERLRGSRRDVVEELKRIARRVGDERWVILISARGDPSSEALGSLLTKASEERLREATVVLPPDAGGLNEVGMIDGNQKERARDVADAPPLSPESKSGEQGRPDRMRVLMTYDAEAEGWTAQLLGSDKEFPCSDEGFRPAARSIRRWDELAGMRETARIVLDSDDDDAPAKALLLFARRGTIEAAEGSQEAAGGKGVALDEHNKAVAEEAKSLVARRLHLPPETEPFGRAVVMAGERHDLGKDRPGWQKAIGHAPPWGDKTGWTPWAKSGQSGFDDSACGDYRHEFGSLRQAAGDSEIASLLELERELALHVIAAHHGWARPHFEEEHWDIAEGVGDDENATLSAEAMRRYARLQRRFGRWGLAWWEALLRAADYSVSARTEPERLEDRAPETRAAAA